MSSAISGEVEGRCLLRVAVDLLQQASPLLEQTEKGDCVRRALSLLTESPAKGSPTSDADRAVAAAAVATNGRNAAERAVAAAFESPKADERVAAEPSVLNQCVDMQRSTVATDEPNQTDVVDPDLPKNCVDVQRSTVATDNPNQSEVLPKISAASKLGESSAWNAPLLHTSAPFQGDAMELLFKARCREIYMQLDEDSNSQLTEKELLVAVRGLGLPDTDIASVFERADTDQSGYIALDEFVDMMSDAFGSRLSELDDLRQRDLDVRIKNGTITFGDKEFLLWGSLEYLINPFDPASQIFELVVMVVLLVSLFTTPLSLAFESFEISMRPVDLAIDILFMADIVRNFNTAHVTEDQMMVCDRRKIAIQYITTWFFPDLFSSMPYRHMFASLEHNPLFTQGKKALKMFRLLRLAKLARLLKMSKLVRLVRRPIQAFLDRCHIHIDSGKLEIYRLCALFFLIIHWVGCLNFMVVREYGFPDDSWVVRAELEDQPTLKQYEWCLYKALAQMITIGLSESTSAPIVATTCLDVDQGFCAAEHW